MSGERHVDHLVIGAGFAGLCAAIKLDEAGEHDFLVVERAADVGGTWRDNTYPGAACDVPSQLYSFSFARNPDWSRSFSPQPEIQAYLQRVARDVHMSHELMLYASRLVGVTRDPGNYLPKQVARLIEYGASPRATLGLVAASRVLALLRGRAYDIP